MLVAMLFGAISFAPAALAAAPRWSIEAVGYPTEFEAENREDMYVINLTNIGDAPTKADPIVIADSLPPGVAPLSARLKSDSGTELCSTAPLRCEYPATATPLAPGHSLQLVIPVEVQPGTQGPLVDTVAVSGGGAPGASASTFPNGIGESPPPFGFHDFAAAAQAADSTPYTQAGGHPYELTIAGHLITKINPVAAEEGHAPLYFPVEEAKDVSVDLPPGVIANPRAAPACSLADFFNHSCAADTQIGTIRIIDNTAGLETTQAYFLTTDLYNLQPLEGHAGSIGFLALRGVPFLLNSAVNTGGDYSVLTIQEGIPSVLLTGFTLHLWGVPAEHSHDPERGQECSAFPNKTFCEYGWTGAISDAPVRPFLRMPTSCPAAPLTASVLADRWSSPGAFVGPWTASMPATEGCAAVPFQPTLEARPTTNLPDAPSGLEVNVHLPQRESEENPEGVTQADLNKALLTLPPGLVLNPAAANGRQGCTEAQIELHGPALPTCPAASKLGSVEVDTQLLGHPLPGSVYLATPHQNPFGSLLALYAVVEDPVSGVIVKLAGRVEADPQTGRLTTSFEESPQLPFEDFHLHLFGGAEGALRTPSVCGPYQSNAVLTPWSAPESGPPAERSDEFAIAGNCAASEAAEPNTPVFDAGTEAPQAGKFSPFAFRLARADGSQELSKIETVLPPGLSGKLAGVAYCPEAAIAQAKSREHDGGGAEELASPSCPAASEVGKVEVGAGAGPDPYYTSGRAYLAGPYAGAPISLVTIVPAVAGPFDLGSVVTRVALHVDPQTTRITAVSDPLPRIIDGIPLDIRSIVLKLDRPGFTLNPTSCDPMSFGGQATSVFGQAAPLTQRFQVGGCNTLPFKPKLALSLKGSPKRAKFPALKAVLTMKPGEADVASAQVTLPHSSFLSNAHIGQTCSHPQLEAGSCPAASAYGHAKAWSPLLEKPLEGNVYLVTGFGYQLPALVADLGGQIEVHLVGKVDSGREDGIRNSFELVPDAPVSRFVLQMDGGRKSLIENSEYLCARHAKRKALAEFTGHNGKVWDVEPVVRNSCKHKKHHRGRRHHKGHGSRHRSG
jgi:hypothetical protein